uniref:Uncharacterized protein n=1 Tax=Anguilla anguilla TaxID=7936 RepID=A0A0E9X9B5_ANGAN
MRFPKKFLI